jgi:hypothetical protein
VREEGGESIEVAGVKVFAILREEVLNGEVGVHPGALLGCG